MFLTIDVADEAADLTLERGETGSFGEQLPHLAHADVDRDMLVEQRRIDGMDVPGAEIPQEAIDISINQTGEVLVKLAGQTDLTNLGQLELAVFANEAGLENIGDNLLLETPASGAANVATPGSAGYGTIRQGFLETSNVNPVSEITSLITAQRAYEMNSKFITAADEMMKTVTTLR